MIGEKWGIPFFPVVFLIGLAVNAVTVWYHLRHFRENKNGPETREYHRKAIWRHCLFGASFAYLGIPVAAVKAILIIVLINVGMWKLVSLLRHRYVERQNMVAERERVPH